MSLHQPKRSQSIKAARASHRLDTSRPITESDINAFKHMIRQERKDRRKSGRRSSTKRPGSNAERAARELEQRPTLPMNERQRALYGLLTDVPRRPVDLGHALGLTSSQLGSAMGGLTVRGLAIRTPDGWRREDAA